MAYCKYVIHQLGDGEGGGGGGEGGGVGEEGGGGLVRKGEGFGLISIFELYTEVKQTGTNTSHTHITHINTHITQHTHHTLTTLA